MSSSERTEKATPKRRDEALKKGQVARSQEVQNLAVLGAGLAAITIVGPTMIGRFEESTRTLFTLLATPDLDQGGLADVLGAAGRTLVMLVAPVFGAVALAAIVGSAAQVRPRLTTSALRPDFNRVNPLKGVKRLVSPHSVVELVKNLAKLAAVGGMVVVTLWPRFDDLVAIGSLPPRQAMAFVCSLILSLCWRVLGVLLVIAAADVAWSRHSHEKSLRMSKEEVKQEVKQQDISPEMRGRLKARQREMARARMLGQVRHADVVITNPTHFAVALAYRPQEGAPRVLAKGVDLLALRIRELAKEHDVAIVENPPLARHLYAEVEVGQHIPAATFAAVAEVLAFVFRLSRRRRPAWA